MRDHSGGVIAAISVAEPSVLDDQTSSTIELVLDAARRLSAASGFRG